MISLCERKFVAFRVDVHNVSEIVNRDSPRLELNALARELFCFGVEDRITLNLACVPREENTLADELSKLIMPDDSMLSHAFFRELEKPFGTHTVDHFASGINTQCERFYSLH